jgi:4-hydroxybenzoate polyprenyltransferase
LATIASNSCAAVALAFFAGEGQDLLWFLKRLWDNGWTTLWVPLTSVLLFAAGMLWNDLVDVDRDRRGAPERPLPSGRVSLLHAYVVGVLLVVGAVLTSLMIDRVHYYGLLLAGLVLILSLLYNLSAKTVPWLGSVVMGLVRAAHACFAVLLIGADHVEILLMGGEAPGLRSFVLYPVILFLWTTGLTLISELEDAERQGTRLEFLAGGALLAAALALAVGHLVSAPWLGAGGWGWFVVGLFVAVAGWCAWRVFVPWWRGLLSARCTQVRLTVIAGLGGFILLDAVLAASAHPVFGLAALACFPVFLLLSRLARMS